MTANAQWDAESVSKLRYQLGLSQDEFSKALGVRQQTISDWEIGLHAPTGASVKLLSMVKEQAAAYTTRNDA